MSEQSPLFPPAEQQPPETPISREDYAAAAAAAARPAKKPRYSAAAIEQGYAPAGTTDIEPENTEEDASLEDTNTENPNGSVEQSTPTRKLTIAEQNANEAAYVEKHHRSLYE